MQSSESAASFGGRTKRLVIVADNSLIVAAIRLGLRQSGQFTLVGQAHPRTTSAGTIAAVHPDAVLIDDIDHSERVIELIGELRGEDQSVALIVLGVEMDLEWLDQIFAAGANGAISKATHPDAMATLLRETLSDHIFHKFALPLCATTPRTGLIAGGNLPLTTREVEILQLVAAGLTNGDVARKLWVTEQTVKFHLRNIYRKLDVANRTEASHLAHLSGLVNTEAALIAAS